jgi:hypothetical protein
MTHVAEQKSMNPVKIGAVMILALFTGATMVAAIQSVTVVDVLSGRLNLATVTPPTHYTTYDNCRDLAAKAAELPESAKPDAQRGVNHCYQVVSDRQRVSAPPSAPTQPVSGCVINKQNYERLNHGISYWDAVEIMGCEGREGASSSLAGMTTVSYTWQSRSGHGTVSAMFQNDRLVMRAQAGLR